MLAQELPLAGFKVLELAQMIAAPSAGLLLADYGAEVIKVEPPQGDSCRLLKSPAASALPMSSVFAGYNRNKRLVRENLKSPEGRERILQLVDQADVLIESSRPGAMEGLGLGPEALLARNPRLVYASLSGYGSGPAGRALGGVDIVVQAESGIMSATGYEDGPPTKVGFTIIDAACGHALCHGILAALLRRSRTGRGDVVRLSLYEMALHLQTGPLCEYMATGVQPPRPGNSAPLSAPAGAFRCRDGHIIISAYLEPHWRALTGIIGAPQLLEDARFKSGQSRLAHRPALTVVIEEHIMTRNGTEWVALLREAGIVCGLVKDYAGVQDDVVTRECGILGETQQGPAVRSPIHFDRTPGAGLRAATEESGGTVKFSTHPANPGTAGI